MSYLYILYYHNRLNTQTHTHTHTHTGIYIYIYIYIIVCYIAQFLRGRGCIDTAIWMHYMDAN